MAINEKLANRVRMALSKFAHVEEKIMFRGTTLMINGKMCISIFDHEILCRIDPAIHEDLLKRKGCRTMVMKEREYKGYIYVTDEAIGSKKELEFWVGLCLEYYKKLKTAKKRSKS